MLLLAVMLFVVRMQPDLSFVSAELFGGAGDKIPASAVDSNGLAVAGSLGGTADWGTGPLTSNGGMDALTVRFDTNGATLWARHDGGLDRQGHARQLTHDDSGGTISNLAQSIYTDRAFERMPILADALEEAGCNDAAILGHCRGPGPHVRGCWVVDFLLGKQ